MSSPLVIGSPQDVASFCVAPARDVCPGICPSPTMDGVLIRYATYLQGIVCAICLLVLRSPEARRQSYYVLQASSIATIFPPFIGSVTTHGGGFVAGYHALLISYLMLGTWLCSAIATTKNLFHSSIGTTIVFAVQTCVLGAMAMYLAVVALADDFGSQPACNSYLQRPNPKPLVETIGVFALPWVLAAAKFGLMAFKQDRHDIFWWPAGTLLVAAWMAFTEYFVRSQHVPVLTDTFGSSQGTLLQTRVIALLMVSLHIALRQTSKELYERIKERVDQWMEGTDKVQDAANMVQDVEQGGGTPPPNPDEKSGGATDVKPDLNRAGSSDPPPSLHYEQVD